MMRPILLGAATALSTLPMTAYAAEEAPRSTTEISEEKKALKARMEALEKEEASAKQAEEAARIADARKKVAEGEKAKAYLASVETKETTVETATTGSPMTVTTTTTKKADGTVEEKKEVKYDQASLAKADVNSTKFGGIEFGVGVAFTHDLGSNDRVKSAVLVPDGAGGQIVRVTDSENVSARLILESHYLFTPKGSFLGLTNDWNGKTGERNWGFGPFVAIQPGEDDVISAIGGGIMLGFRRPGEKTASFNIGVGVMYDLNVRLLGEGIMANRPLPPGESEIRYREEEQSGFLLMTSYSF